MNENMLLCKWTQVNIRTLEVMPFASLREMASFATVFERICVQVSGAFCCAKDYGHKPITQRITGRLANHTDVFWNIYFYNFYGIWKR